MMSLTLYNTLTRRDEEFTPRDPERVTVYTCGPTVYGRPHIGNYASFLMADLLVRWLEAGHGYTVIHAKNITDVGHLVADRDEGEDKIEKQAMAEKLDPLAIARKYEAQYLEDEKALNMREPQFRPRATEFIPQMISMTKKLLSEGKAYETGDGIYFSVETFPSYGSLSGNTLEKLDAGSRVKVNEDKKHPADFALWKKCTGENAKHLLRWSFETGERSSSQGDDPSAGFPGWHIECSAMSTALLGESIELHTGGEDNIFPHHECEIAQSECVTGKKPFVRLWLHRRRIDIGEQKMSKSLGNVLSLPDIQAEGFSPLDLRYYLLSVQYRTNLKFSKKGLDDAKKARRKITEWIHVIEDAKDTSKAEEAEEKLVSFSREFRDAMDNDLNTPQALSVIFEYMNWFYAQKALTDVMHSEVRSFIAMIRSTFGCFEPEREEIPEAVTKLMDEREVARGQKNFAESDRLRDAIAALGYEVRDGADGQSIRKV